MGKSMHAENYWAYDPTQRRRRSSIAA